MTVLIQNGRLLDPATQTDRQADLLIRDGKIAQIADAGSLSASAGDTIDASGCCVAPGLIDMHVHLREPGEEYKEDIGSGSKAAVAGGFTTIVAMPNTKPAIDNAEIVHFVVRRGREEGICRVLPSGSVTIGQKGEMLAQMADMARAGAVAFTDDGHPVASAHLMRRALEYAANFDAVVLTHAEELDLSRGGDMHEGAVSTALGLRGIPRTAEDAAVARDILLAELTGGKLHICHVSTAAAVELIRVAKANGVAVTGEGAPHHFTLTHKDVEGFGTSSKMSPPLRESTDRDAVIAGLRDGTLDAIATDHAPHSTIEKDCTFAEAANGVIGLQTALPLSLDLWRDHDMPLLDVIERLTTGPARVLSLPHGSLKEGEAGDVVVFNPDTEWTLTREAIVSKSKNSPFIDRVLRGRVESTIFEGQIVYRAN